MRFIARAAAFVRRVVDLALLGLIATVVVTVIIAKGAPLAGRQSIVIGGGSMEPTIPLGAAIIVAPVDPGTLAVGDVVSMQVDTDHTTYTHRIVTVVDREDGRWFRTKGDANAEPDPTLVPATAVIGRIELTIPFLGYLVALLSLPVGVMFVLGLGATLLAIAWLLESLEPDRVTVTTVSRRVPEADPDADGVPALAADPRLDLVGEPASPEPAAAQPVSPEPVSLQPVSPETAFDPAAMRGEPIAARPRIALSIAMPIPATLAPAFAGPSMLTRHADASVARPTVRQQLAKSREVRNRRARWQRERGDPSGPKGR